MTFLRRPKAEWFQLLALIIALLVSPFLLPTEPGEEGYRTPFNTTKLRELSKANPEVALIGNSMTDTRIDLAALNGLIQPHNASFIVEHGSRSTVWYFLLKNFATELTPPPKVVIIFFRDYDFTNPALNLTGVKLRETYQFMKPGDEHVIDLADENDAKPESTFASTYFSEQLLHNLRRRISNWSLDIATIGQPDGSEKHLQKHLDHQFGFTNLRGEIFDSGALENDLTTNTYTEFTADPRENLLPRFVEIAKKHNIKLCFYRVKRRPGPDNIDTQNRKLVRYMTAFKAWAESQGCYFYDDTEDPNLTHSMYGNGDHLTEQAKPAYTRIFFDRIKPMLSQN